MRWMIRSKIHRATVTDARLDYEGSITVDEDLLDRVGIWVGEKVLVADVNNGSRFETYTLPGERGSGIIALNGAAAHMCELGDKVIIMAFELTDVPIHAKVALVDDRNRVVRDLVYRCSWCTPTAGPEGTPGRPRTASW
jgi:aspartate 1-decarboxylase